MSTLTDKKLALIIGASLLLALGLGYFAYQHFGSSEAPDSPPALVVPEADPVIKPQADQRPIIKDDLTDEGAGYSPQYTEGEVVVSEITTEDDVTEESNKEYYRAPRPASPAIVGHPGRTTGARNITFQIQGYTFFLVRCSLNQASFSAAESCSSTRTYSDLPDGRYTFRTWQSDNDGNISRPAVFSFTVKRIAPSSPTVTYGPSGTVLQRHVKFRFRSQARTSKFRCSVNNSNVNEASDCRRAKGYHNIPDGNYQFRVWRIDRYGNVSKPTIKNFTVNATYPEAPRIVAPGYSSEVTSPVFVNLAGQSGASFYCSVNKSAFAEAMPCPAASLMTLGSGTYILYAWQIDKYGRRSPSKAIPFIVTGAETTSLMRSTASTNSYSADSDSTSVTNQSVDAESNLTLDVLAAIEIGTPSDDQDATAPLADGSSDSVAFSSQADIRSNLSWAVTPQVSSQGYLQGGATGSRSLLSALSYDSDSSADSGARNSSNAAQEYQADFDQTVSWGDEAGAYIVTVTHQASQTLP